MKTYGIFIGSFNPITNAHINICNQILKEKLVKKIIIIPVTNKKDNLININERINMIHMITSKNIIIDDLCKNQNNFNYKTLDIIKEKYKDISIIIGSDILINIKDFENTEHILKNFNFIVIPRSNINNNEIINKNYKNYKDRFIILNYKSNISSTLVRNNIKNNKSNNNYLNSKIEKYIISNNLYKN